MNYLLCSTCHKEIGSPTPVDRGRPLLWERCWRCNYPIYKGGKFVASWDYDGKKVKREVYQSNNSS